MSNKLTFELVHPGEFEDYYYKVSFGDMFTCHLLFYKKYNQWFSQDWRNESIFNSTLLIQVAEKINELNAATKADKLFGFL